MTDLEKARTVWHLAAGKWTALICVLVLWLSKLGLEILPHLPDWVAWTVVAILLGLGITLLFEIHDKVRHAGSELRFANHEETQRHIEQLILQLAGNSSSRREPIQLQIVGVALSYSCPWIRKHLRPLLEKHPQVKLRIDACIVDHQFLASCPFDPEEPLNWPKEAANNLTELQKIAENPKLAFGGRLKISLHVYRNLPHWHGILLDNHYLYLGRANWMPGSFDNEKELPRFTVGQNPYRHYHRSDSYGGEERIQLFLNWFSYYRRIATQHYGVGQETGHE